MTLLKTAQGTDQMQCDGCGRTDAGAGVMLDVQPYSVNDPNVGGKVTHHYCGMCASNRGANMQELTVQWPANNLPAPEAAPEQELAAELPAPVEEAVEAAERVESHHSRKAKGQYD